jgi:hypothetical protein
MDAGGAALCPLWGQHFGSLWNAICQPMTGWGRLSIKILENPVFWKMPGE